MFTKKLPHYPPYFNPFTFLVAMVNASELPSECRYNDKLPYVHHVGVIEDIRTLSFNLQGYPTETKTKIQSDEAEKLIKSLSLNTVDLARGYRLVKIDEKVEFGFGLRCPDETTTNRYAVMMFPKKDAKDCAALDGCLMAHKKVVESIDILLFKNSADAMNCSQERP